MKLKASGHVKVLKIVAIDYPRKYEIDAEITNFNLVIQGYYSKSISFHTYMSRDM